MPSAVGRMVAIVAAVLILSAVGAWVWRALQPGGSNPPAPAVEVEAATAAGVRFEIERRPRSEDTPPAWGADSVLAHRDGEFLDFADGVLVVNGIGFPSPKPGDVVRWNLTGPLLINGEPQTEHPLQPRRIDAPGVAPPWTTRGGPAPRNTPGVGWSRAGRVLVTANGDGAVRVWDADKREVRATLIPESKGGGTPELRAAISPDGKTVAIAEVNSGDVTLWDADGTRRKGDTLDGTGKVNALALAEGGRLFVSRGGSLFLHSPGGDAVGLYELGKVHTGVEPPFALGDNGKVLARNDGRTVTVYRLPDPVPVPLPPPSTTVEKVTDDACLALSSDGKLLAVFDGTSRLAVYDTATGKLKNRLRWRPGDDGQMQVTALAFAPDGQTLAVGGPGSVRLYDVPSGRERGWVPAPQQVRALAYSADGRTLAAGLRYAPGVRLWETADLVAK